MLPGLAITTVVLAFNFFGDCVRDTLVPKLPPITTIVVVDLAKGQPQFGCPFLV